MRAITMVLVAAVLTGCVSKIRADGPTVTRCNDLRQRRDIYSFGAAGTATLAGAGGLSALELDREESRRRLAALSLAVGAIGAILVGMATATGNAYAEEGCPDKFARMRAAGPTK